MKLATGTNQAWLTAGALFLSAVLSLHAISLNQKAIPKVSNNGVRLACELHRSPATPLFLVQGLICMGVGAIALRNAAKRQTELARQLAMSGTAADSELAAATGVAINIPTESPVAVPQPVSVAAPILNQAVASTINQQIDTEVVEPVQPTPEVAMPTSHSNVAKAISMSDMCLMICASPGCGKTTLTLAAVAELFGIVPGATFMGVVGKASKSDMCGIQSANPDAMMILDGASKVPQLFARINALYREYNRRARIADPATLRSLAPCILYLGDYPSLLVQVSIWMSQAVDIEEKRERLASASEAFGHFATLLTNGRELNTKIWIDGQEFNAGGLFPKGIDFKMSLNLRECMAAVGLGFTSTDPHTQRQRGSYAILENMLKGSNSPFSDADRKQLAESFNQLRDKSLELQRPLCITNANGSTQAEILPDLRAYETFKISTAIAQANGERVRVLLRGGALHDLAKTFDHIPRREELEAAIRRGLNQSDAVREVYGKSKGGGSEQECGWYNQVKTAIQGAA